MEGTAGQALTELLRRAHADELEGLAAILKVSAADLGFAKLVQTIDQRLRRAGGHELANMVLRQGAGPSYRDVVTGLLRRGGLTSNGSLEADEEQLLIWAFEDVWANLGAEERALVWQRIGAVGIAPSDGTVAVDEAHRTLGDAFVYRIAALAGRREQSVLRTINPLFGPFAGPVAVWRMFKPKDHRVLPAVLEVARLRQVVRKRVTVGIVGSPSTGKDAAIGALFGVPTGNISPIAGSTREVQITQVPGATALFVINTPGMGDVVESVTEEARQILSHVDVFLYVVNAQGGVQQRERDDHRVCVDTGRPVLALLNKVDTLRPDDRERMVADTAAKLEAPLVLPVAFDPLPQLSDTPLGVDEVKRWLHDRLLEAGKDEVELASVGL